MLIVGIDIAKVKFDATWKDEMGQKSYQSFDNTPKGFKALQRWVKKTGYKEAHFCMEATNIYWEAVAEFLHKQGYKVSVVNPARIKGFAQSQMRRNKTDKVDSDVIADFCHALSPKQWLPPKPEERQLRNLVRHRCTLIKTRTQQKNRLATCQNEHVRHALNQLVTTLNDQLQECEQAILEQIKAHSYLKERKRLLLSIKGLGPVSAHVIMAEMYDLNRYDSARAAAADAGLSPAHHDSGDTVHRKPKLSKVGKASVRGALYLPALAAIQHNTIVKNHARKLELRKKPPMVIVGAAMRKLIHIAYGVLKHQTPFEPNYSR